ncbi:MAG: hypothetical protein JWL77_105 [Chthonomonadaceae bacterium]|nr:hypothetical protein [Chthonomonadaceae bacterium]
MTMERKSRVCLTSCTVLLLAAAVSAGAQAPPPAQPGPGVPSNFGQRAQGQQPGTGGFGGGGQNRFGGNPGGMPMGMMNFMPNQPEIAKRMLSIMALRQINGIGLAPRDISSALPALKTMRDAEKANEARSIQILEEEKRALLTAQPDSPPPPDSGQRMQEANEAFRQQMARGWETIANAIGPDKAGGLRNLVEGGGMIGPGGPNGPGGFGGPLTPPGAGPGQPGQFGNDIGPAAGAQGPRPGNRRGGADGPGAGAPQPPGDNARFTPNAQAPSPGGQVGFGGQDGGQGRFGGRPGQPGQGQGFPGQQPGRAGQGMPGMGFGGPRISLTDLVDLLEQKQAAMRR